MKKVYCSRVDGWIAVLIAGPLLFCVGLIRYIVPYIDIRKIEKSSNPLSSPALSFRRVKITRKKGFLLVSPPDRDQFINDLSERLV